MFQHWKYFVVATALCFATATASFASPDTNRPAHWAQPVTLAGVPNFYLVTTNLYRGAQPTADGMVQLQALGVRSVMNLRIMRSDRHELHGTTLKGFSVAMVPWHADADEVVAFLKAATDTNNLPMFVHCERGADRTGMMCAMYRVVVCDWTKEEAIREMKEGGFHFSPAWKKLVSYVKTADVADLKKRVGLPMAVTAVAEKN